MTSDNAHEIRELYSMGESIENIAYRLWIKASEVSYFCGRYTNSPPKKYIRDDEKREDEIKRLSNARGKSYKEILYLNYLRGNLTQEAYESAFNNN